MDKEKLAAGGIDYDGGVARMMGNTELYEKFLKMFLQDNSFAALEKAMDEENYAQAFLEAHTLKGVTGNLSMQKLYEYLVDFVNMLRNGSDIPGAVQHFPELKQIYKDTVAAIQE